MSPVNGTGSIIDLAICHSQLFLDYNYNVDEDLHGSDHFPILLKPVSATPVENSTRWKLQKADWKLFEKLAKERLKYANFEYESDKIEAFSNALLEIAEKCIPKTSGKPRISYPWFNDDCKNAIKDRKKSLNKFKRYPTQENLFEYKRLAAKAKRTIKKAKRDSWQQYVNKLNSQTPIKKTWSMIRKISGKNVTSPIKYLQGEDGPIRDLNEITNKIGATIQENSSSNNYSKEFQNYKNKTETKLIEFGEDTEEYYNKPISLNEIEEAIKIAKDSAAGPDNIHYQLLKHLPNSAIITLLHIFNDIFSKGNFPSSWREANIIPIPKPGKDSTLPGNYRPIALTNTLCKTMERIINKRLIYYLEKNNIITPYQAGFRKGRSTFDQLINFESNIREAFIRKQHLIAIFFDLEKAYDTTWKYGILRDLKKSGLRGLLPSFIGEFLKDRTFKVKIKNTLSDEYKQEMGVPQGSILSPILFILKMNSIVKCLEQDMNCSLYVDDFLISCSAKDPKVAEGKIQKALDKLQKWCGENGFKFSSTKTTCVHFHQKRGIYPDPCLKINNNKITVKTQAKFLGIIFDKKLTFVPHIKYLKDKCAKALNVLKVVSHTDWGGDRKVLLRLYRSLIRSKLDYGSFIYGSARKSYLKLLDPIAHQGLRLALGAFRTTPIQSLYAEAGEPPLYLRRKKLALQYIVKLSQNRNNPTYKFVFNPKFQTLFQRKPRAIPTFGIRNKQYIKEINLDPKNIIPKNIPPKPPWLTETPNIIWNLSKYKKVETSPEIYRNMFSEVKDGLKGYISVYTDGSKMEDAVAAAAVSNDYELSRRLLDGSSIFSAEIRAILLGLSIVRHTTGKNFILFTDSKSSLQAIEQNDPENPLVSHVLKIFNMLKFKFDKNIMFCWIPSHIGIRGNERADTIAKHALSKPISIRESVSSDIKSKINQVIRDNHQNIFDQQRSNKLHDIYPKIGDSVLNHRIYNRHWETKLTRLLLGHTRITHSFLLKAEPPPQCIGCATAFTVKHFMLECVDFSDIRKRYFRVKTLKELFDTVPSAKIVGYLKEVGLFNKI